MYSVYGTLVVLQHRIRDELLFTNPALVRPLPRMVPHVDGQGGSLRKTLGTNFTGIRFFFGMDSHVNAEQRLGGEALLAELATERSLPSVGSSMIGQRRLGG